MDIVRHIAVIDGGKVKEIFSFSFLKNPQKPHHIVCSPDIFKLLFGDTPYESLAPKDFLILLIEFYGEMDETYKNIKRDIILKYPRNFINKIDTD